MKRRELLQLMTGLPAAGAGHWDQSRDEPLPADFSAAAQHRLMYLHPGEVHLLLGRPCNGKSTLALSIALDWMDAGKSVWYFSMGHESLQLAARMNLELRETRLAQSLSPQLPRPQQWHVAVANENKDHERQNLVLFDHSCAVHTPLRQVQDLSAVFEVGRPDLVIYDAGHIDKAALSNLEEHTMASALRLRREEARRLYNAPILITHGMPPAEGETRRPGIHNLRPRGNPGKHRLVEELHFVHRPMLYQDELAERCPDVIELSRSHRTRRDGHTRLIIKDGGTERLRPVNHAELARVLEHGERYRH